MHAGDPGRIRAIDPTIVATATRFPRVTHTLEQLQAGQLAGARQLKLACGLTEFPRAIFDLADTLEVLDLTGNALSALPDDLPRLHRLRILFASGNRFTAFPDVLGACGQLDMIGFKANRIQTVPSGSLPRAALADPHRQRHRRIAGRYRRLLAAAEADARGQPAAHAPGGNGRMPRARTGAPVREPAGRTARLAAAPAAPRMARHRRQPVRRRAGSRGVGRAEVANVDWASLACEQKLGEGASGVIYRAQWRADGHRHGRSRSSCSRAR